MLYAVYAGFAFVSNTASLWILFLIYGIYFGLAEGAEKALVADLVRPEQRGTAYGLYNLAFGVTVFPASLLMGMIWDWKGPTVAFLVSAVMGQPRCCCCCSSGHAERICCNETQSFDSSTRRIDRNWLLPRRHGGSAPPGAGSSQSDSGRLIGKPAFLGAHSIGGLVLHIGEAEWFWMQMVVAGHQLTEEDKKAPYWDVLDDVERVTRNGYTTEFCLNEIDLIRNQTRDVLFSYNDKDLERIITYERNGETTNTICAGFCIA